ncbi:docking protein 2 [Aulostomus maculatus]
MEEDIRKQGTLYLQQQRFGKKWKRVWCVLYRESSCSISRLELYEWKDGGQVERSDKSLRKQQENKKVIRLADCIRVTEMSMDGCPRDTGPFLIETTEKIYVFAADRQHLDDWTHKLCQIAFPVSWAEHGMKRGSLQRGNQEGEEGMEDNSLYSGRDKVRDFRVCVRRTEVAGRCRLKGDTVLRAGVDALHLLDKTGDILLTWPYRYLRRFGRDKTTFSFEAGRRCQSGEGSFEFDTKQGNLLFQAVEDAINLQRISVPQRQTFSRGPVNPETSPNPPPLLVTPPLAQNMAPQPPDAQSRLEPVYNILTGIQSLALDTSHDLSPHKNQVKMISSCPLPRTSPEAAPGHGSAPCHHSRLTPSLSSTLNPEETYSQVSLPAERRAKLLAQEPEYSLPFDTIAKNVMTDIFGYQQVLGSSQGADPLYDSIDETRIRNIFLSDANAITATCGKVEHIYDEPEGCAATAAPPSVYDNPKEMTGDAWRIMGTTADLKGHEYPYDPRVDDYAVPKHVQRACPVTQNTNKEEEEEDGEEEEEQKDSPYKNLLVKMT